MSLIGRASSSQKILKLFDLKTCKEVEKNGTVFTINNYRQTLKVIKEYYGYQDQKSLRSPGPE